MARRRTVRFGSVLGAVALATGSMMVLAAAPATASPFQVSNANDSGSGSLRQAFADAAAAGGEIDVDPGLGPITLTSGPITYVANGAVTVVGNGVVVDGNGGDGVLHKAGSGALSIDGVTITGSDATDGDVVGAVTAEGDGDVSVSNCAFIDNTQTSDTDSGSDVGALVLSSSGSENLSVASCTFSGNVSTANQSFADIAGAIDADSGGDTFTITNSTFSNNSATSVQGEAVVAGAIDNELGSLTIVGTSIDGNTASSPEGNADVGAVVNEGGDLSVSYSSFTNNSSSGGAEFLNIGAAMNNEGGAESLLNVTATGNTSTVSGVAPVSAGASGGVGRNRRVHDQVAGNVSTAGWLNYGGEGTLVYVTMTGNGGSPDSIYNSGNYMNGGGEVSFFGTAIGDPVDGPNCALYPTGDVSFVSHGYNAEDDADATCGFSPANNDKVGSPLGLAALANNGGPGLTQLPQAGSVLLDAIPPASCQADGAAGVTTDERGVARPQGPGCEIGAVEVELVGPAPAPEAVIVAPKFTG